MSNYKQETIKEITNCLRNEGFRVFIAERGNYGFFTDEAGSRVVSFELSPGGPRFTGNYKTDDPKTTGTGWLICEGYPRFYREIFDAQPPTWAVGSASWRFTTFKEHTKTHQSSSRYAEATSDE